MKPILKIIESCGGRVVLSKEEFEEIINKTYEQGFEDGQRAAGSSSPYINQRQPFPIPIYYETATRMTLPCDPTEDVIIDAVIQTLVDENEDN